MIRFRQKAPVSSWSEATGFKRGFTLMELMVYMAILGIIVIVAGRAFSDSTKFRVRTQNILKATQEAENVATLFKSDVAQMGAKSSKETTVAGGDDSFSAIYTDVYWNQGAGDLSSFLLTSNNGKSDLSFRRVRYNADGSYKAVEEISWFVDENNTLKRSCRMISGTPDADACPQRDDATARANAVEIATDVGIFQVYSAIPLIRSNASAELQSEQIFPPAGNEFKLYSRYGEENYVMLPPAAGGESVTLSGFKRNYDLDNAEIQSDSKQVNQVFAATNEDVDGTWRNRCTQMTLSPGIEYEISFQIVYPNNANDMAQLFVPGRDHMSVGFRNVDGEKAASLDDFLFYPPTSNEASGERTMRFTVPDTLKNQCLAFTFASYSPRAAEGTVTISNLKLRRVASSTYFFDEDASLQNADKKNVKAFRMKLRITRSGETGDIDIVIPTPSNGVVD